MNQLLKALLFSFGIGDGLPPGVWHAQRVQGGTRANEARFAGDMDLIDCGCEASRISKVLERFAPGTLMRRCEQHAINVENGRRQRLKIFGPGS